VAGARSLDRSLLNGLVGFEAFLYAAVALLLATEAVLVLLGTVHKLAHAISTVQARSTPALMSVRGCMAARL
jgi:hypothetical protein